MTEAELFYQGYSRFVTLNEVKTQDGGFVDSSPFSWSFYEYVSAWMVMKRPFNSEVGFRPYVRRLKYNDALKAGNVASGMLPISCLINSKVTV